MTLPISITLHSPPPLPVPLQPRASKVPCRPPRALDRLAAPFAPCRVAAMLLCSALWALLTHHVLPASAVRPARRGQTVDVLGYVNPLIGSQQGGNVFAGAVGTPRLDWVCNT